MNESIEILEKIKKSIKEATQREREIKIVLKGQYKEAFELLMDSENAELTPAIIGPPGVGKTLLCRYYALKTRRKFYWMTFDESTKPSHLIGVFNPAIVLSKGWCIEAFEPGPLTLAMIEGGIFVANELNRASEYTQNVLLEPLEEKSYYIPHLGRIIASKGFFFIATLNPQEYYGVHRLSEALLDRIQYDLPSDILEKIYVIVKLTRENEQIMKPASIRSSIAMARLIALYLKNNDYDDEKLAKIAFSVLLGSIKVKPGVRKDLLIRRIISEALSKCKS